MASGMGRCGQGGCETLRVLERSTTRPWEVWVGWMDGWMLGYMGGWVLTAAQKASVEDPMITASPDAMLHRGVAEYTFIPDYEGGVLGRGKFSTVFKVKGTDGLHVSCRAHIPITISC